MKHKGTWEALPDFQTKGADWPTNEPTKSSDAGLIEDGNAYVTDKLYKQFKEKNAQTIDNILEIGLPKKNEQLRLITMNSFNASAFIELIAKNEGIKNCVLVIFAINLQAAEMLIELTNERKIKNLELVVSSVRNAGHAIKSKAVELLAKYPEIKMCFVNSHAKISAMSTNKGNYYLIEGSGNFSYNGRIEQYIIDNDKKMFDFTLNWISEMKRTMSRFKDFKIVNG